MKILTIVRVVAVAGLLTVGMGCRDQESRGPGPEPHGHEEGHDHHEDHGHDHGDAHGDEHADEVTLTPDAAQRSGIRVEPVGKHALTQTFVAPGTLSFNEDMVMHVGSPLTGRVVEVGVSLGATVKLGDALLVIDSAELGETQSDFLQKSTAVEVAAPAVELAQSAYERARSLYEGSQGIALTEVQKREAEFKAAQGELRSAQAALTAARDRLRLFTMDAESIEALKQSREINPRFTLRAGSGGRVVERSVTRGQLVGPEDEALIVLADTTRLWALAEVPESWLGKVREGAPARVSFPALGDAAVEGTIALLSPRIDPAARTATARIVIDNADARLRAGMFAHVEIDTGGEGAEPVLAVPEEAVQTLDGRPVVFVPVEDGANTFAKREVVIGERVGRRVEIVSGLKEGEPVVVAGSFILKADLGKAEAEHEH